MSSSLPLQLIGVIGMQNMSESLRSAAGPGVIDFSFISATAPLLHAEIARRARRAAE